ncbi:hypothetical protein F4824DRAFT_509463 [Ustulina deusta]|nr:hypothetical protein F4824DRAFT_509463 [Ustulina deusta]
MAYPNDCRIVPPLRILSTPANIGSCEIPTDGDAPSTQSPLEDYVDANCSYKLCSSSTPLFATLQHGDLHPVTERQETMTTQSGEMSYTSGSAMRLSTDMISPAQLAFSAMQFLPVPLLLLDSLKTIVLANDAMGRLLGFIGESPIRHQGSRSVSDILKGKTLSQIGVDILKDGDPMRLSLDSFLEGLKAEMRSTHATESFSSDANNLQGSAIPKSGKSGASSPFGVLRKTGSDSTVDIVITFKEFSSEMDMKSHRSGCRTTTKMVITSWEIENHQTYYMMTFNDTNLELCSTTESLIPASQPSDFGAANETSNSACNQSLVKSLGQDQSSTSIYPSIATRPSSCAPFPAIATSSGFLQSSTPSSLQKVTVIKDALLDNTEMPILAMWKDGSAPVFNRAARELFKPSSFMNSTGGYDVLPSSDVWNEDFTRKLTSSEFPTTVLLREQKPFSGRRIGAYNKTNGKKVVYDVLGEILRDEKTGEMIGGVVTCRDFTYMAQEITNIKKAEEERFKLICDTMPQMVWTATPDGMHDFFNKRWYEFTHLTPEDSLGLGWQIPFHPDDMAATMTTWNRSLETGDPYRVEYRCLSKEGEWRWMLGRALPLKDKTGKILKWFGTCTDVHETMEAKLEAKQSRKQLLSVLSHAQTTIFSVDRDRKVTMLEGALIRNDGYTNPSDGKPNHDSKRYIGRNVDEVFNDLGLSLRKGEASVFLQPVDDILAGRKRSDTVQEHEIERHFYKTRFMPIIATNPKFSNSDHTTIEGAIGVIVNVTELKEREQDVKVHVREKRQYMAKEAAAKEASRLKSQFLANMSHEIRTPITGVLGMTELLLDSTLQDEQLEYAENIRRSANALLGVINDILDFSKIESGRLDVEEVQFSLPMIVKDVTKMLSFTAERKNLDFSSDISPDIKDDLKLLGDPGRVRQVITNLLTNSIKFTSTGYVRFSVSKAKETNETLEIKFVVEDSGIGIQPEVRKRLFEPFSQGDPSTVRKFGGSGLGLTISKNLLDLMKGKITLESTVGNGTIATFWIPFAKPQPSDESSLVDIGSLPYRLQTEMSISCTSSGREQYPRTQPGGPTPDPSADELPPRRTSANLLPPTAFNYDGKDLPMSERSNIHVLVVEDNAINQQIALKKITKLGFKASAVWNGQEALEYIKESCDEKRPKPDIILMDVQMPVIDGYKCTHILRHDATYKYFARDVPIVAMTASAIQGDKEKCTKAGMDDYLPKPVSSTTLEKMLVRWSKNCRRNSPCPSSSSWSLSDGSESAYHGSESDILQNQGCRCGLDQMKQDHISGDNRELGKEIFDALLTPKAAKQNVTYDGHSPSLDLPADITTRFARSNDVHSEKKNLNATKADISSKASSLSPPNCIHDEEYLAEGDLNKKERQDSQSPLPTRDKV